jgi:hypothetical protein
VEVQNVTPAELDPAKTPLVHLTGTAKATFSAEDAAAIKAFVEKGGTLLIDSAGGAPAFAQTAEELVKAINLGGLEPLFDKDPLFAIEGDRDAITKFGYRGPVLARFGGNKPGPLLQGVKVKDRWGILFSREDIVSGLMGSHTWIAGYEPETAVAIVRNLVAPTAK